MSKEQASRQQQSRHSDETLEQCQEKLRDLYMNYKDLVHRCLIDIKQVEKGEKRVFYFKPESFLLDDPEKQRLYREKLIKKITAVPHPEPITFMGDELHKQLIETIQDRSEPSITRKNLAQYFKRRHYNLQHKKYKVLVRWAHHALTTEYMERIGHEATFKYGKMEYEMENSMSRSERLEGEDDFDEAKNFPRPNTKAKEGGSLYVENTNLEPTSAIRMDDVEVYLRQVTYEQKINKLVNKFVCRLKWLPLYKRFDIWNDAVDAYHKLKESNLTRQENLVKKVLQRGELVIPKNNQDMRDELEYIVENYHVSQQRKNVTNKAEQIMFSQRSDHELAPHMVDNSLELKVLILDKALEYGIYGDIELDQGYSFAYQITIFFPTYFQRQIIKSQFSLYDAFAGEEKDLNAIQKRNLMNMAKIDTNIFKDISTTKNNIPSQESLNTDEAFTNIKIVRLKSSAYWIDYCCVQPKIPAHIQKQAAFLSMNNPIDSLLKSAMNFLDVNDLATVNRILEETARLHQSQQKEKYDGVNMKGKKKQMKQQQEFKSKPSMQDEASNMKEHFYNAIKGDVNDTPKDGNKDIPHVNVHSLRYLPQHLIHAYYILRQMKSRDYKTKLLYSLNYFRAIQKRLMLDLREFGTRERILGDLVQPIIPSTEADKISQINANSNYFKNPNQDQFNKQNTTISSTGQDDKTGLYSKLEATQEKEKQFSLFEDGHLKTENSLVDMKKFKFKGKFNNKIFSTCPVIPRFHATFGEPIEFQPINVEMERIGSIKHVTDEGVKLMGRVDHIEVDYKTKEVYVKDDFGIYVLYDCTLQDMKDLEDELLKVGSYYISKHEALVNTENEKPYPVIDRLTLLEDLLADESEFQFSKVVLIQAYMECYEHITDPLEQQRLIQIIVDMMAQRPRLNLNAVYFRDSYEAEVMTFNKHLELIRNIITNQMMIEKEENKRTQAYLDLTYKIANEQNKQKWTYADAEEFFNELKKRKATISLMSGGAIRRMSESQQEEVKGHKDGIDGQAKQNNGQVDEDQSPTKKFLQKINEKHGSKYAASNIHDKRESNKESEGEGGFAAVLGLPPITVESLYMQYKEKDEVILEIMNENANFVRVYEGYPDFLLVLQGLEHNKLCQYKFTDWSMPINVLDFYESLTFITKFYATIQSVQSELVDVLKPHDSTLMTLMELKILERAEIEYQKTRAFFTEDLKEFKGAEYLEDESIIGNPDKLTFYVKDVVAHLSKSLKQNINPFFIGKLDLETINFYDFPQVPSSQNPYTAQIPQFREDMEASLKIAEQFTKPTAGSFQRFFPQLKEYMRKINISSMLTLYCNMIEILRLRQELLFAASECVLLSEVYEQQCKMVNRQNNKVYFTEQINFNNYLIDQSKVNYIDDGPAKQIEFDLAIQEFDQLLKSNLNFRNPDAIKMLVFPSGLEELRAVVHYQLMQKQLLIIGVRMNQLLLDTHQRALNELELVKRGYAIPNMVIKLQNLICKTGDGFNYEQYSREKQKFLSNLVNEAGPVIYNVNSRKTKLRNTVSKKFSVYLTSVASTFSKVECSLRVLRAYKVKLLHSYCKEVLKEAYHDAMKVQALHTCQKLRLMSQIFSIDENTIGMAHGATEKPQIFKYETHEFIENFFAFYNRSYQQDQAQMMYSKDQGFTVQALKIDGCEIINYFAIPSSISIMKCESITYEELSRINQRYPSFDFSQKPDENDVEKSIKELIPKFVQIQPEYPEDDLERERYTNRMVDFQQAYDYPSTLFARMFQYYAFLHRFFNLKYFIGKLSSNLLDTLKMEECIFNGLPFWGADSETEKQINMNNPKDQPQSEQHLSEAILKKIVAEKRSKVNLADDIINISISISAVIKKIQQSQDPNNTAPQSSLVPKHKILEYLLTRQEVKYLLILHVLDKVQDSYYQKEASKEIKTINEVQQQFTRRDHVKIVFKHSAFHVNAAATRPDQVSIDNQNLFYYYANNEDSNDFLTCIQPIVNEHALNPPQITLFEGIYSNQKSKSTQFAGQIPNSKVFPCLETALINLNEQERQYVNSTIHSIRGYLKDYLEIIHKETTDFQGDEGQNLDNLKRCKKFLSDLIQAKQLKNALIMWLSTSTLPLDPKVYQMYLAQYKNDIFWKIMHQKDQLIAIYQDQTKQSSKNVDQENKLRDKLKQAETGMLISQQYAYMQNQALIDQVQTCKAEIIVLAAEIERQIVKAAIKAVDSESAALANCFQINAKQIDMHIHPFQQFASTCYSQVDSHSHLDMVTKISEVQRFITKLRNRGTEVETLTSGPGMVFTIKDFNECLQVLCRGLIKYGERELRSRSELMSKKEQHYIHLLYVKDRKIENLEERINNTRENLDKLINSKMYEKGNQLIYELDQVNRQLRLFKDNLYAMERELRSNIKAEFADTLRRNMRDLDTAMKQFKDFKNDVTIKVKADLAQEQHRIEKVLKKKAEEYKNLSVSTSGRESVLKNKVKFSNDPGADNYLMVQEQHHDPSRPSFSVYLDEINKLSEREARSELAQMWEMMRKLRIFWKTKEILTIDKYEKEIFTLKKQQTSNACLWEQLAEAEKREKVLKQELVFTQQSLAASEKVIEKLKDDLRKSESDRVRLNQYKINKSKRLEELEGKVRKFEVLENINLEKLIDTLSNKEKEIMKLKDLEKNFNERLGAIEKRKDNEVRDVKVKFQRELNQKRDVLERLESLRMELRMLEKNEGSMAEVWKTKCKELVEICNKLKIENEQMRGRLFSVSQNLQGSIGEGDQESSRMPYQDGSFLPKLMPNAQQNKMLNNIQASKYGAATASQTRHSSVTKIGSQILDGSLDKSLLTGIQENSMRMSKGFGMSDASMAKIQQNNQYNLNSAKMQSQKFAIKGQQAQIQNQRGYQLVRNSEGEPLNKKIKNGDLSQEQYQSNPYGMTLMANQFNLQGSTHPTTSVNQNLISAQQSVFSGRNEQKSVINSNIQSSNATRMQESRLTEQRKDHSSGGAGLMSNMSLHITKKKSNNMDLSGFIPTNNDNSPIRGGSQYEGVENQSQAFQVEGDLTSPERTISQNDN